MNTIKLVAGTAFAIAAVFMEGSVGMAQENPGAMLQAKTQNGVTYLCGGVGQEEANEMKRQARAYDLMLTFATHDGSYLAGVGLEIKDAAGDTVLQTRCDGPILLADLPRGGVYHIHAEADYQAIDKTIRVNGNRRGRPDATTTVILLWPQPAGDAARASPNGTSSGW